MTERNSIITKLYQSKEVNDLIGKIQPYHLQEDLLQYAFATLCEKPDEFIIELDRKDQLRFFLVKIITNSMFSSRSKFYLLYKNGKEQSCESFDNEIIDEHTNHELIDKCEREVKKLYWYHQELLRLYSHHGNYRAVAKETGIPLKSVFNAVKKAKKQVKQNICKQ